jgi:HK97 family phage prohead protease
MMPGESLTRVERKFAGVDLTRLDAARRVQLVMPACSARWTCRRIAVEPGAFRRSLEEPAGVHSVRMLFQHDPNQPIGRWLEIREDARGLFVRGQLTPGVAKSQELLKLMRAGAIDGLSIGFRTVRARKNAATGVRQIFEADLWEISVVTFPMLPEARVARVKGIGPNGLTAANSRRVRLLAERVRRAAMMMKDK